MAKQKDGFWERDCQFRTASIGAEKYSIGAEVQLLEEDDLNKLRGMLVNARLEAKLRVDLNGQEDDPNQQTMTDDDYVEICAITELNGFRFNAKTIGLRLNFADSDVDIDALERIKCCSGILMLKRAAAEKDQAKGQPKLLEA